MFLDNLAQLKKIALFKYLEKGDFTGYDFCVEENNIRNGKDLLDFLGLFVKYNCFDNNLKIIEGFVGDIYNNKSIVILYEAYLINTNPDIEKIIGKYSFIVTKESFEFEGVNQLLEKTRDILESNKNKIIIYNSINNILGFKDSKIYFNFLLELLEVKNSLYFKEINLIFNLLMYGSNKALVYQIKELVYFFEHEYDIDNTNEKKYIYSLSKKIIKDLSMKEIDYKNIFMKNILNYLGKNDFYIEFFENNLNIKLKELLFRVFIGSLNKNNLSIDEIKKDIKLNLTEDKRQLEKLLNDFKKDVNYIKNEKDSSYADYLIEKI